MGRVRSSTIADRSAVSWASASSGRSSSRKRSGMELARSVTGGDRRADGRAPTRLSRPSVEQRIQPRPCRPAEGACRGLWQAINRCPVSCRPLKIFDFDFSGAHVAPLLGLCCAMRAPLKHLCTPPFYRREFNGRDVLHTGSDGRMSTVHRRPTWPEYQPIFSFTLSLPSQWSLCPRAIFL